MKEGIIFNKYYIERKEEKNTVINERKGILYVIATPIGNLGDITLRALETLNKVDFILCEDTRHSHKILKDLGKTKNAISYHKFNEKKRLKQIIDLLKSGKDIALISDAGTPGISDPGALLIQAAIKENISIEVIPGACAVISALILSGFNADAFIFGGYLPKKSKERLSVLAYYKNFKGTIIFFESPHRVLSSLKDISKVYEKCQICVAREITKLHQEVLRGRSSELLDILSRRTIKGEITILIENVDVYCQSDETNKIDTMKIKTEYYRLIETGISKKEALKTLSQSTGLSKKIIYSAIFINPSSS